MDDFSEALEFLRGVTVIIREQEFLAQVERIHQSGLETIKVEAEARRQRQSADIRAIHKFDISIDRLKFQYERIKPLLSPAGISTMDKCLEDLKCQRKRLVNDKGKYH